ncbi:MAG: hypothetical protein FJX25_01530 [Alphaproteobacteria bacterium]|nr:hypothetical protein [Alphaproteobacteria bacterium]
MSRKEYEDGHRNNMPGFDRPYEQLGDCPDPKDHPAEEEQPVGDPAPEEPAVVDPRPGDDTQLGDPDLGP